MSQESKEYSVDVAVPQEGRHYGFWEMVATWIGANANTSSWFTGGVVAAMGFGGAIAVILIANPIAYIIMALIGYMGYKVGTTTMGLARVPFGIKGSILPSILNMTQFIGWCACNTFIAAIAMSFLFNQAFGWPALGMEGCWWVLALGVIISSVLQGLLAVSGGSRSIKIGENIAAALLIILTIWETVVILQHWSLSAIVAWKPPIDLKMPFGVGMDVMAAFSLGWVPAIAEFTRYTKNKISSTVAPMIGANVALFWFAIVGLIGVIATTMATGQFDPNTSDPSSIMGALGLGWVAFLVLILATITTNCVNIYAAGMSVVNVWPKLPVFKSLWGVAILCTLVSLIPIVLGSFLDAFMGFLGYVGLIFAPLFAIMIVDFYILRKRKYDWSQASKVNGAYWYKNGVNWRAIVAWTIGVITYVIIKQLPVVMNTIGAIYGTLIITAIVYWLIGRKGINVKECSQHVSASSTESQ